MNENETSGNDPHEVCHGDGEFHCCCKEPCDIEPVDRLDFNHYAVVRAMRGVLSEDDYDELRDF